jgi:TetR/AcrR family acrAB operon transcriptional repressor
MMARRSVEEAAQTRESLLVAVRSVFSRKEYASTTLEEIAEDAGVTRGVIYWHYGGKTELNVTLLSELSGKSAEIVQTAAIQGGSLVELLRRIFVRLL